MQDLHKPSVQDLRTFFVKRSELAMGDVPLFYQLDIFNNLIFFKI
jgi:hypothetical protein